MAIWEGSALPIARPGLARRGLFYFAILLACVGAILVALLQIQLRLADSVYRADEKLAVSTAAERIRAELSTVYSDIRLLAQLPPLATHLDAPTPLSWHQLNSAFSSVADAKPQYAQIRLLDLSGREVVRINSADGIAMPAGLSDLQDKTERYYVPQTAGLELGEIYVSPFDLNVESGVVQSPPEPMIRFGTPVFDSPGRKAGMVILNYRGQDLLQVVSQANAGHEGYTWLLNGDGFWLRGPSPEDEWGFMFPERADRSFARQYPSAWERMSDDGGQFVDGGSLITHAQVSARDRSAVPEAASIEPTWHLVRFVPSEIRQRERNEVLWSFALAFAGMAIPCAAGAMLLAQTSIRQETEEAQRRASETRLRTVWDTSSDGLLIATADGDIEFCNDAAVRLLHTTRDSLVGAPLAMLIAEESLPDFEPMLAKAASADAEPVIGAPVEITCRVGDGRKLPTEMSISGILGERGHQITIAIRDITLRKENERLILDREERFRTLIESAPDAMIVTNTNGTIMRVNMQTEILFQHSRHRLVGDTIEMLLPERFRDAHRKHRENYAAVPRVRLMGSGRTLFGLRSNGTEFAISVSLSPIETDEGLLIISAIRDVTERRGAARLIEELNERLSRDNAELAAVNRELEAFSYSVSHDLRAPLRAIDGFSQALQEDHSDDLDDRALDYLARVRAAAQRMGVLIDEMLRLARVSRSDLSLETVDLAALARPIIDDLRTQDPSRKVEFSVGENLVAAADPRLMSLALQNLLENAWKFTSGSEPAIIRLDSKNENGQHVFFVSDNGVGFDPAYARQLFRVFNRLHNASDFPGNGIGLATVMRIIIKHGGWIWAESQIGQGATFHFTLAQNGRSHEQRLEREADPAR